MFFFCNHIVDDLVSGPIAANPATWGVNDTLVAFARAYSMDVIIHHPDASRLIAVNGSTLSTERQAHLAYIGGVHYMSVDKSRTLPDRPPLVKLGVCDDGKVVRWRDTNFTR